MLVPSFQYHSRQNGHGRLSIYAVYQNLQKRMIIVQPFIPAVTGKRALGAAEQDAQRVGNWVLERIATGSEFAISKADLDNLGIVY